MSKLAIQFYGNMGKWREIASANGIENPDLIRVGQTLTIPGLSTVTTGEDYMFPSNATTALPEGVTRSPTGELRIPITGGAAAPPVAQQASAAMSMAWLRHPAVLAGAALLALLALRRKPTRRRRRR